jgi:processive 1,2-diacylglycerol beta-glucosyltransferase
MSHPRVLILHVPAGAGHAGAARAVEQAIRLVDPAAEPDVRDALEFASPLFKALYATSYNRIAARAPRLWGYVYHGSEFRYGSPGEWLRIRLTWWNCRGFEEAAARLRPDVILCTQFLPVEVYAYLRERGRVAMPVHCVITDFAIHPIWVYRGIDRYYVATDRVAGELVDTGIVPAERIQVTGVPIHPRFASTAGREAARRELGLDPDPSRPTVLLMGGGFGWGPMEGMLDVVLGLPRSVQALVIAGRNEALRGRLAERARGEEARIKVHGYTDRVDLFLEASDLLVGKSGGLTSSEAMARGVPMVVLRPIPGQEERNCNYLVDVGAAQRVHDLGGLEERLRRFLADPEHRAAMRAAAARIGRPRAALDVAGSVLGRSV